MASILGRVNFASFLMLGAIILLRADLPAQEQTRIERRAVSSPRPWQCDLLLFTSRDGQTFERSKVFVQGAGVACVIRDARNRLVAVFQWFPSDRREAFDKVAVAFSED